MSLSPLRYPGGKSKGLDWLRLYLPEGTKEIISPFLGGGSFELDCASKGIVVKSYDLFTPLVEFWQCAFENPENLVKEIKKLHPMSKECFYELQKKQDTLDTKLKRAAAFFALNRSSFSGSTLSGGMSLNHPRFNERSINKILAIPDFVKERMSIEEKDFELSIKENSGKFFYCDPPYMIKESLYGKKGSTHKGFNHKGLKKLLDNEPFWMLSYNNSEEIMDMYSGYRHVFPDWKYGMSKDKSAKEVLFFSSEMKIVNK